MRLEARKYLYDIQRAAALLTEFTVGKTFGTMRATPCCVPLWSGSSRSSERP